jgi:hypothetical protein
MIKINSELAIDADSNCYIVGKPRSVTDKKTGEEKIILLNTKYYGSLTSAVNGCFETIMRNAVMSNEITTLKEFVKKLEEVKSDLVKLISG